MSSAWDETIQRYSEEAVCYPCAARRQGNRKGLACRGTGGEDEGGPLVYAYLQVAPAEDDLAPAEDDQQLSVDQFRICIFLYVEFFLFLDEYDFIKV